MTAIAAKCPLDFDAILEVFGFRTDAGMVHAREGRGPATGGIVLGIQDDGGAIKQAALDVAQARYLADRLAALASKVERKAKSKHPCEACGKP